MMTPSSTDTMMVHGGVCMDIGRHSTSQLPGSRCKLDSNDIPGMAAYTAYLVNVVLSRENAIIWNVVKKYLLNGRQTKRTENHSGR